MSPQTQNLTVPGFSKVCNSQGLAGPEGVIGFPAVVPRVSISERRKSIIGENLTRVLYF